MAIEIKINESNASNRCVPIWCVQSNGTSACTNESGATFMFEIGGVFYGSGGSISAVSAVAGLYTCIFSASKVSVAGVGQVMYSSGTALPVSTPFRVTNVDSYDSTRFGLVALPNFAASAASGLLVLGTGVGGINASSGSVAPIYADYSSLVTVGVGIAAPSKVTVQLQSVDYSSKVTVGVGIAAPSLVTVQLNAADYSSLVTVGVGNIKAAAYSGVTVDGAKFLSAAGERSAASSLLSTDMGSTRLVQEALFALRNKVVIGPSNYSVYQTDDTTVQWGASIATTANVVLTTVDPT